MSNQREISAMRDLEKAAMSNDEFKRLIAVGRKLYRKEIEEWGRRPLRRLRGRVVAQTSVNLTTVGEQWAKQEAMAKKITDAEATAKLLFQTVSREIGGAQARRIFAELAGPHEFAASNREIEAEQNRALLEAFDLYEWPVQKLARHLAAMNRLYGYAIYGTRFGHSAASIDKQLRRLLKKRKDKPKRRAAKTRR